MSTQDLRHLLLGGNQTSSGNKMEFPGNTDNRGRVGREYHAAGGSVGYGHHATGRVASTNAPRIPSKPAAVTLPDSRSLRKMIMDELEKELGRHKHAKGELVHLNDREMEALKHAHLVKELTKAREWLARNGRYGDTRIGKVSHKTSHMLDDLIHGGKVQRNPRDGLREYAPCGAMVGGQPCVLPAGHGGGHRQTVLMPLRHVTQRAAHYGRGTRDYPVGCSFATGLSAAHYLNRPANGGPLNLVSGQPLPPVNQVAGTDRLRQFNDLVNAERGAVVPPMAPRRLNINNHTRFIDVMDSVGIHAPYKNVRGGKNHVTPERIAKNLHNRHPHTFAVTGVGGPAALGRHVVNVSGIRNGAIRVNDPWHNRPVWVPYPPVAGAPHAFTVGPNNYRILGNFKSRHL